MAAEALQGKVYILPEKEVLLQFLQNSPHTNTIDKGTLERIAQTFATKKYAPNALVDFQEDKFISYNSAKQMLKLILNPVFQDKIESVLAFLAEYLKSHGNEFSEKKVIQI